MSIQLRPTLREALAAADRPLVGMWTCTGSTVAAEICAGSGLDWLLIDMEHSPVSLPIALAQLQVAAAYPVTTMLRVASADTVLIKQALDVGAQNLLVPMVSTADQAREVAAAMFYPPRGVRGVGSALARSARWNRVPGYVTEADQHVSLTVQIETAEGVANAAQIAAVDGVDAVFVGPSDLSASMGLLGQQTHPDVIAAVHTVFEVVHAAGKPVGVNAFDPVQAYAYLDAGADFILVSSDVTLLARGSERLAAEFLRR